MKKLLAEAIGTFALVFAGTGAIVVNDVSGGGIGHAGIALTFGLVVLVMIYTVGDISGAHLNPAVTSAFWLSGRFPGRQVCPYVAAECAGAFTASGVLHFLFPAHATLGTTLPAQLRAAYLKAACGRDAQLLARVEALFQALGQPVGPDETAAGGLWLNEKLQTITTDRRSRLD